MNCKNAALLVIRELTGNRKPHLSMCLLEVITSSLFEIYYDVIKSELDKFTEDTAAQTIMINLLDCL